MTKETRVAKIVGGKDSDKLEHVRLYLPDNYRAYKLVRPMSLIDEPEDIWIEGKDRDGFTLRNVIRRLRIFGIRAREKRVRKKMRRQHGKGISL